MLKFPFFNKSGEPSLPEKADTDPVELLVKALDKRDSSESAIIADLSKTKLEDRGYLSLALVTKANTLLQKGSPGWNTGRVLLTLASKVISARGSVSMDLFPTLAEAWSQTSIPRDHLPRLVSVAEHLRSEHGLTPELEAGLRLVLQKLEAPVGHEYTVEGQGRVFIEIPKSTNERRLAIRIRELIAPNPKNYMELPEPWQAPFNHEKWFELLRHADTATATSMPDKWAKRSRQILQEVGEDDFLAVFGEAAALICSMAKEVDILYADMLRGLAWMAALTGLPEATPHLGRLVRGCAHKIPGVGARSQKGFNGAVGALETMGSFESLAQLSNARNRIKIANLSSIITAALDRAALQQSVPLQDLEELVVPTYSLELPGVRTELLGTVEARLEISGTTDASLRWFREGNELKSPPAEVKTEHAEALKDLKAEVKEIHETLTAQRSRIERLMVTGRELPYLAWRKRYLDHPLLANMVKRLVWRFKNGETEQLGMAPNGEPLDAEGNLLEGLDEQTTVRLWHPIHTGIAAIEVWREFLVSNQISQPFKQAHREIYLLTAAEEQTATYSNRFAAHILKQHQFNALAHGRGWRYQLQGGFDNCNTPRLDLPEWGISAEYFVDAALMGTGPDDVEITHSGVALYISTDQVRFLETVSEQILRLEAVPALVFTEVMRDVDLFVGVASVGNDPTWQDQGTRTGYDAYWRQASFGDLSATAQTRKAVLSRLLPRMAIADVAKIDGRFLVVQGKLRTYKIHLGSGNILMEPNDQYLCIVPGRSNEKPGEKVYLPFEGDGTLAIILSKAMMLANDNKITDPTILTQLNRRPV